MLNALIVLIILIISQSLYHYDNWDSEGHLFVIPKDTNYDILMLGASHGRVLSSSHNHERLEKILSKNILNLSKTAGGVVPEKLYFSYFYTRGNSAKKVVYFLDPFVFFSKKWNEGAYFLEDEPLSPRFLLEAIRQKLDKQIIFNYIRSKFTYFWFISRKPSTPEIERGSLEAVNAEAVRKRMERLYPDGMEGAPAAAYSEILEETIRLADEHNNKIIFILMPTQLGDVPGSEYLIRKLKALKESGRSEFYNLSDIMREPKFYSDHDHLNTEGVEYFTKNYLKLIIEGTYKK